MCLLVKMKKNIFASKKASHVGMILSFAIFIGALFFLYTTISPQISMKNKGKYTIDEVEGKLFNRFKDDLTTILVKVPSDVDENTECIKLNLEDVIPGEGDAVFQVKDKKGNNLNYEVQGNYIKIDWDNNIDFVKIIFSLGYIDNVGNNSDLGCNPSNTTFVRMDAAKTTNLFFEGKITETANLKREEDYNLKEELEIFPEVEFDFVFINHSGKKEWEVPEISAENIYITEKKIAYVDFQTAELVNGSLKLRVWNKG